MAQLVQKFIVEDAKKASPLMPQRIALVDPKGKPVQLGGEAPGNATAAKPGLVKQGAAVADVKSADAAESAAAPTKEEFAKAVKVANETKKQLNALLKSLKDAGVIA